MTRTETRESRICTEANEPQNRLFRPCLCNGSMAWVHRTCLQRWRTTGGDLAFQQCFTCKFVYNLAPPDETPSIHSLLMTHFVIFVIFVTALLMWMVQWFAVEVMEFNIREGLAVIGYLILTSRRSHWQEYALGIIVDIVDATLFGHTHAHWGVFVCMCANVYIEFVRLFSSREQLLQQLVLPYRR